MEICQSLHVKLMLKDWGHLRTGGWGEYKTYEKGSIRRWKNIL
jgi:hypothetical protein